MNNEDHAELAQMLADELLTVELIGQEGGQRGVYSYIYVIRIPGVQERLCGVDDLAEYEGLDWLDFSSHSGTGFTLKEAWDEFSERVEISTIEHLIEEILKDGK